MRNSCFLGAAIAAIAFGLPGKALAFDCAKASTQSEKAICADPDLKAADDALTAAYESVMKRSSAKDKDALRQSQKDWIARRDAACSAGESTDAEALEASRACLRTETVDRTNFLLAKPEAGPGLSDPPIPFLITRKGVKGKSCDVDVSLYRFAAADPSAGRKAFNAQIEKILADYEKTYGDAASNVPEELDMVCYWSLYASFAYASDDLANLATSWEEFSGGAHPNHGSDAFIVDLRQGRILSFSDVFGDAARKPLVEACTASLREEKIARMSDSGGGVPSAEDLQTLDEELAGYAEQIAGSVGDFSRWVLTADGAKIMFNPYEVGAYVEGDYECSLTKGLLQRVAGKGGWIVP